MKKKIQESEVPKSYILRQYAKGKLIHRSDTGAYQRFLHQTRLISWEIKEIKVVLKVTYADKMTNSMDCYKKSDLDWGVSAFVKEYR